MEKSRCNVLQVFEQGVIGLRPVHGEVEAVFVALGGVGKVAGIGAVGDHKQLQKFIQRVVSVKALFAVAMHLIKRFTNGYAALFQFIGRKL